MKGRALTKRNALCPCGSGKRFKHCHGRHQDEPSDNAASDLMRRRREAMLQQRRLQQGLGRPIQSYPLENGNRAVVIGRSLMVGQWATFTDFLLSYLAERIGKQWFADEMSKGDNGHPMGKWAVAMREEADSRPSGVGIVKSKVNNGSRSLHSVAYNLNLIEHHYEQHSEPLFERMLNKLRASNDFASAISETNVAAYFLKAGFFLEYEDDVRPGHHAEFTARFPTSGKCFSVEVKTRTGSIAAHEEKDVVRHLRLKNKLSKALRKRLPWPRVVFIDLNIANSITDLDGPIFTNLLAQVEEAESTLKVDGALAPPAYLFLMNQPFHYNLHSHEAVPTIGALGFRIPTFNPRRPDSFRDIVLSRDLHPEMHALIQSMKAHSETPSTFDGQHPEFAFGTNEHPRWFVGESYLVPGPHNQEVEAVLQNAIAVPEQKKMYGVFLAGGHNFLAHAPMTDAEVGAYQRSPETFFGVIENVGRRSDNALDLAEFFFETYQHTSKEKLLEFLSDHPDIERLRGLSQRELAIIVCEQWALNA
jgi:hypothetical protein